jgi:fumarylpyruvate hydrolase
MGYGQGIRSLRPRVRAACGSRRGTIDGQTTLQLHVNGTRRQHTTLGEMVHTVPEIIAVLSTLFELKAGDLIFTGTPAGVAALQPGDSFHAELVGVAELVSRVV